jgi:hypothetical protein
MVKHYWIELKTLPTYIEQIIKIAMNMHPCLFCHGISDEENKFV